MIGMAELISTRCDGGGTAEPQKQAERQRAGGKTEKPCAQKSLLKRGIRLLGPQNQLAFLAVTALGAEAEFAEDADGPIVRKLRGEEDFAERYLQRLSECASQC
jgi:hypothetical protein